MDVVEVFIIFVVLRLCGFVYLIFLGVFVWFRDLYYFDIFRCFNIGYNIYIFDFFF